MNVVRAARSLTKTAAAATAGLSRTARMALYTAQDSSSKKGEREGEEGNEGKVIFAPAGNNPQGQAPQFTLGTLALRDLDRRSPIPQFHKWFSEAQSSYSSSSSPQQHQPQPEACALSTASLPSGRVSSRMVYLKELDARGRFVVYTNLGTSLKAHDLASNPHASLVFYWPALQRQVRVEGVTERCSTAESQRYFDTRVRGSRIGAWASRQSQVLVPDRDGDGQDDGRAQLEAWVSEAEERFAGRDDIPVPDFWGGLRIVPDRVEFWQGRDSRLHDRFVYRLLEDGEARGKGDEKGDGHDAEEDGKQTWILERLSP